MIYSHNSYEYICRRSRLGKDRYNGAYYYSREIVENIMPRVNTDYNWVTVNAAGRCWDHSIVFIHDNKRPERYRWLSHYKDLVLVCGVRETVDKVKAILPMHKVVYLPLSIDIKTVEKHKVKTKTKSIAFAGRPSKVTEKIPKSTEIIGGLPRDEMLDEMAKFQKIYAVGRTALEAKVLGCKIEPYDDRFPDPSVWVIRDNVEAARILQTLLNRKDT